MAKRLDVVRLAALVVLVVFCGELNAQESHRSSVGIDMRLLPAGRYERGCKSPDVFRKDHANFNVQDARRHYVVLTKPFYLATTEVTRGQFREFIDATGYRTTAERDVSSMIGWDPTPLKEHPGHAQSFQVRSQFSWMQTGFDQDDDHPVVGVSYNDAMEFCRWLSSEEGKEYRLPTEAEWEYAARAGSSTFFPWGDQYRGVIDKHANIANTELSLVARECVQRQWIVDPDGEGDGFVFTAPVGSFPANSFGLRDMQGNVWEWCQDLYLDTAYEAFKSTGHHVVRPRAVDPLNTEAWNEDGQWQVIRGGSWFNSPIQVRSGCRGYFEAQDSAAYLGFRVALDGPDEAVRKARERYDRSEAARESLTELAADVRERRPGVLAIVIRQEHMKEDLFEAIADLDEPIDLEVQCNRPIQPEHIEKLAQARDIRGWHMSGNGQDLADHDFAPLANHPRISRLQITGMSRMSDAMMGYLSGMEELESINLHGEGITDEGLKELSALKHVQTLIVSGTEASGAILEKLKDSPLREFHCKHFTDEQTKLLQPFADSMRRLNLNESLISDKGLAELSFLRNLQDLNLVNCSELTDEGIVAVRAFSRLSTLHVDGTGAGDRTAEVLADAQWLRELHIGSAFLTDRGIHHLSEAVGLHDLVIESESSKVTDASFEHFWRLQNLRSIRLRLPTVTGAGTEALAECKRLDRIHLAGVNVDDSGLEALSTLHNVSQVSLGGWHGPEMSKVTAVGLMMLSHLSDGTQVSFHKRQLGVDDEFVDRLRTAAPHLEVHAH